MLKAVCPYLSQVASTADGPQVRHSVDHPRSRGDRRLGERGRRAELFLSSGTRPLPRVHDFDRRIRRAREPGAGARWETIKKFEILATELSVDEGEVTPSLKVRRKAVEEVRRRALEQHATTPTKRNGCEPSGGCLDKLMGTFL